MPKQLLQAEVVENVVLTGTVKKLTVYAPAIAQCAVPGQFLHLKTSSTSDPLLRRPLSISSIDVTAGTVSTIYRIVGRGTEILGRLKEKDIIDTMGPLGTGFFLQSKKPLLVGGGMGTAPLVFLAQRLCPRPLQIVLGGRNRDELFWTEVLAGVCQNVHITTDDGTLGTKGNTLDVLPAILKADDFDMIYACGPRPMLEGVARLAKANNISCQVSLEEHMACGVGACLSCTCGTQRGERKKVCTDGPVFWAEEVI